jgi:hypothetical protein
LRSLGTSWTKWHEAWPSGMVAVIDDVRTSLQENPVPLDVVKELVKQDGPPSGAERVPDDDAGSQPELRCISVIL